MAGRLPALWLVPWLAFWAPAQAQDSVARTASPPTLQVGPARAVATLAAAARLARAGTTIEVDAGEYTGDVAVWEQEDITLRAVGGRVRLQAAGAAAEGKAIWVLRGGRMLVQGFDFSGASVRSRNGAGIRLEKGQLTVEDCTFTDNENGILTSGHPDATLDIVNSEFGHNGFGDGLSHNLYVGAIARLSVSGSYFHHARVGHLLKSRAALNFITYNRLTDGPGGRASYELEFPSGGVAFVIGNLIEQGAQTENPHLVSFGIEDYPWPRNALYLVNNTLVDRLPKDGIFLRVRPGDVMVKAVNNLLAGPGGRLEDAAPGGLYSHNHYLELGDLEAPEQGDYRPRSAARVAGGAIDPGSAEGVDLRPQAEYAHPRSTRPVAGRPHNPGALQNLSRAPQR